MTSLRYQVCNLLLRQNNKGKFCPYEIGKDMIDFYTKKVGNMSAKEFTSFLLNSSEKQENKLLKAFILFTLNFFMMVTISSSEETDETRKIIDIGKPIMQKSFENIINILHSEDCMDILKELSITN